MAGLKFAYQIASKSFFVFQTLSVFHLTLFIQLFVLDEKHGSSLIQRQDMRVELLPYNSLKF